MSVDVQDDSIFVDNTQELPRQIKDLKACLECGLLLNTDQWRQKDDRCPNSCRSHFTKNFEGMISMCKPSKSWVARRIGLKSQNLCVGLYAVNLLD